MICEEDWDVEEPKWEDERKDGNILLTIIKENLYEEMVKILPSKNLNTFVRIDDNQETTPLLFAISENKFESVKALLLFEACPNFGWRLFRNELESYTRPLHYAISLEAASKVNPEIIDVLLESDTLDINSTDGNGDTPFALALSNGRMTIVEKLLEKGYSNVLNDVCKLIRMNREIHLPYWRDIGLDRLLYQGSPADKLANCGCYNGCEEVLWRLKVYNYDISKRYRDHINEPKLPFIEDDFTLLHVAVLGGQEHLIDFLINSGCNVNTEDFGGNTPLHCAAFVGSIRMLEKLLFWKADMRKRTKKGLSALYIAVEKEREDFVETLVDLGAFALVERSRVRNKPRDTSIDPLALAIVRQNYKITSSLLKSAGRFESLEELHYCILKRAPELANLVINHLGRDATLKLKDDTIDGIPALHELSNVAISDYRIPEVSALVKQYISKGYDINRRSADFKSKKRAAVGFTALLAAVDRKNLEVVKVLIENGAEVNVADDHGYSALHWCALVNASNILAVLISAGANCYALTKEGRPVIHVAADEGHVDVVMALLHKDINMVNWKIKYSGFLSQDEVDKHKCQYNINGVVGNEVKQCTPFQRAVYMSKVDVCRLLLIAKESQLNGLEELHYSVRQGDIPIANVLLSYISPETSLANDEIKNEPALSYLPCRCLLIEDPEDMPKFLNAYIMRGYNINSVSLENHCKCKSSAKLNVKKLSLLHMAVIHENLDMLDFLVNNGADIDLPTEKGHTPLFLSVYLNCHISVVSTLVDKGANVNHKAEVEAKIFVCRESPRQIVTLPAMKLSPLGVALYNKHKEAFKALFNADAKLDGVQELDIAMKTGNVKASLKILKRLPHNTCLAGHYSGDREPFQPLLHQLIERCSDWDQSKMIATLREFITEYSIRGYNVDFNGTQSNVKPLLVIILEQCINNRNSKILDTITAVKNWDPNVKYLGQTALNLYLNRLSFGDLNCNHNTDYGKKFCALDCALTLLKYGADGTQCSVNLTQSQHTTKWKILVTFGVNLVFTDYDEGQPEALRSFVENNSNNVQKLKHIARLAIRKLHPEQLEALDAKYLPMELKRYLYLENLYPIAKAGLNSLGMDSFMYSLNADV